MHQEKSYSRHWLVRFSTGWLRCMDDSKLQLLSRRFGMNSPRVAEPVLNVAIAERKRGYSDYFCSGNLKPRYVPELTPINASRVPLNSGIENFSYT